MSGSTGTVAVSTTRLTTRIQVPACSISQAMLRATGRVASSQFIAGGEDVGNYASWKCNTLGTVPFPSTKHMDSRMRGNDRPGDLCVLPAKAGTNRGGEHPVRVLGRQCPAVNDSF